MKYVVCDIGGSSIKYALSTEDGKFLDQGKTPAPGSLKELYEALADIYKKYEDVSGVAISLPGAVDPERGYTYTSGALNYYNDTEFVKGLSAYIPVPITIGNDAKCAANAEVGYGALKDVDDGFVIVLGTGIGGCLVKDHKVVTGKHFASGEVSNVIVNPEEPKDYENSLWYMQNGISGLLKRAQQALNTKKQMSGEEIFSLANNGNEKALQAIDRFARDVAVQLMNINTIIDVERFAIGGGISAQPLLLELINKNYDDIYDYYKLYNTPCARPEIVPCQFRNDANLLGALYQHLTK